MRKRCGTQIPDSEYLPKPGEEGFHIDIRPKKAAAERVEDSEIPKVTTLKRLVRALSDRTASEIVRILASEWAERRYGPSASVICEVADEFSEYDPKKAFLLCKEAWERTSDPKFLSKLVPLAAVSGRLADAASYLRTARYLGIDVDASPLLSAAGFPEAAPLFELTLSEAVVADPSVVPWIPDRDRSAVLAKYWKSFSDGPEPTPAELLERLEFGAVTMLDPEFFFEFCERFASTARAGFFHALTEYAQSEPSRVSEAYFLSANPDAGPFAPWAERFQTPSILRRRLFHAVHHFSDPKFLPAFRNLRDAFAALESQEEESVLDEVVGGLESAVAAYGKLPDSLLAYRERTLAAISDMHGSSYYPRLFSRAYGIGKPFAVPGERPLALLVSDGLLRGMDFSIVSGFADRLTFVCSDPDAAYLVGASFSLAGHYYEAVEWLSKSRLSDPEPLSLLLRIVAEMPDLAMMAVETLSTGLPVVESSTSAAISRVRSIAASMPPDLSGEMVGDAEQAFGDPDVAVSSYLRASESGNGEALKKAADLWYAMGKFKKAHALYERAYATGAFPEIAGRLCLGSLAKGDRESAAGYLSRLEPTDPENAEAFARFHCVRNCPQELFAGLSALAAMPYGAASELPHDLLRTYWRFAKSLASGLPDLRKNPSKPEIEPGFREMFTALRALPFSLDAPVSEAFRYVRYVRSMAEAVSRDPKLDVCLFGSLSEVLAVAHGSPHAGQYASSDAATRSLAVQTLFLSEAKVLTDLFGHLTIDRGSERSEYVRLLLEIAAVLDMLGDADSAGYFRHSAAWAAEGGEGDFDEVPPSVRLH